MNTKPRPIEMAQHECRSKPLTPSQRGKLGGRKPGCQGRPLTSEKSRAMLAARWAKYKAMKGVKFSPPAEPVKKVTLQHGETGRLLKWPTNKAIPHGYAVILWHPADPCGDCDPFLGGRPDQCAMLPTTLKEHHEP